ncbi:SGNH/GDSL hydrolase family protein [Bradyrhizobium ganzhouense]|uniref:SGNH/GDSL hydrolase family protein n=1 Tax=Bradyrhizobium ganzhouense TaxID=1179767 RepID=UPI003CE92664
MASVRHLIVDGSSSSVDNGGAGTISYHTLYLPHASEQTVQQSFATDGATLRDMIARQAAVIAALTDGPNILFIQGGQNDLLTVDPIVWLSSYSDYLADFRAAIASSQKLVKMGISTHNPRNDAQFNAHRAIADQALRLFPSEGKCDFIVDWAIDQTWGPDSAASNQTLYPDGTHPSQAGQANMEAKYFRPVLNSLFASLI